MFRPQFSFATPKGFKDVPYVRPVNIYQDFESDTPPAVLAPSSYFNDFPIRLDDDADQLFRSLFWMGNQQGQGATSTSGSLQIRLRDAYGNFLTDGYVPLWLYCWGAGSTTPDGGSGRTKVWESEIYCPAGSLMLIDFYNPDGANYQWPGYFEFRGVKRWPEGCA